MATAKATKEMVEIKPIEVKRVKARLVGDTPLIVHTWSEKARKEIRDKELKIKEKTRPVRKPVKEGIDSIYWVLGRPSAEEVEKYEQEHLELCKKGEVDIAIEQIDFSGMFHDGYVIGFPPSAPKKAAAASGRIHPPSPGVNTCFSIIRSRIAASVSASAPPFRTASRSTRDRKRWITVPRAAPSAFFPGSIKAGRLPAW